jgi:hypothetical protein
MGRWADGRGQRQLVGVAWGVKVWGTRPFSGGVATSFRGSRLDFQSKGVVDGICRSNDHAGAGWLRDSHTDSAGAFVLRGTTPGSTLVFTCGLRDTEVTPLQSRSLAARGLSREFKPPDPQGTPHFWPCSWGAVAYGTRVFLQSGDGVNRSKNQHDSTGRRDGRYACHGVRPIE